MKCSATLSTSQLREDFKKFDKIDMNDVIKKAEEKYFQHTQTFALCHYVIKDNKVKYDEILSVFFYCLLLNRFIENVMVNMLDFERFQMEFYYHFLEK